MPEKILDYLGLEAGIFGDGEEITPKFLKLWAAGKDYTTLPGLVYKKEGTVGSNPAHGIANLNALPYAEIPRWIKVKPYFDREASYPVQAKRGCPFDCIYCTYARGEGKCYRFRSPAEVAEEVVRVQREYRPKTIEFVDSIFNHPPGFAEDICRELIRRKHGARLHTIELNPKYLTTELVSLMEKAGFVSCGLTCESASGKILKNLNKSYGAEEVSYAARILKHSRLKRLWIFLLGGPGEDESTVAETLAFVNNELGDRDVAFFNIGIRIYPGTEIEGIARREKLITEETDLLYPAFYLSPAIDRQTIEEMIGAVKKYNIVTIEDIRLPYLSNLLWIYNRFRLNVPYWSLAPIFNRIRRLLWLK